MPPHSISRSPSTPPIAGRVSGTTPASTGGRWGPGAGSAPALATSPAFQLSAQISLRGAGCLAPKSPARAKNNPPPRSPPLHSPPPGSAGGSWHRSAPPWHRHGGALEMPPPGRWRGGGRGPGARIRHGAAGGSCPASDGDRAGWRWPSGATGSSHRHNRERCQALPASHAGPRGLSPRRVSHGEGECPPSPTPSR